MWWSEYDKTSPPFLTTVKVKGKPLRIKIQKGASVSIIKQRTFKEKFSELQCEPADDILRSYRGVILKDFTPASVVDSFLENNKMSFLTDMVRTKVWKQRSPFKSENAPSSWTSEWAAAIAPVLRLEGSVRICGDLKVTVNPAAILEKYLVPRVKNVW